MFNYLFKGFFKLKDEYLYLKIKHYSIMGYKFLFIYALIWLFNLYFNTPTAQDKNQSIELREELTIGLGEFSPESSFARPRFIEVDSKGYIYIADVATMDIRVFDQEGIYQRTIGNRGRGPGEFLSIELFIINDADELLIFDVMQFRITKFNKTGEILDEINTSSDNQYINYFVQVEDYRDDLYIALYKRSGHGHKAIYNTDELFHIWDSDFQEELDNFGSFEQLGYSEPYADRFIRPRVGSFVHTEEDRYLFAPHLYEGKLYEYAPAENKSGYSHIIEGYDPGIESSITLDSKVDQFTARSLSAEGEVFGKAKVISGGLFQLKNRKFVHFVLIFNQEISTPENRKWEVIADFFDSDYNNLGYKSLGVRERVIHYFRYFKLKDSEDRFYTITEEEGVPVVKVYSLEIKHEE